MKDVAIINHQPARLNIISKIIGSIYKRKANYLLCLFAFY